MACRSTFLIRNPKAGIRGQREMLSVPCGKCPSCVSNRILTWQFRLEQELKVSTSAFFVTLTYSEDFVPIDNVIYNHDTKVAHVQNVLRPRDLSLYFKRLRKSYAKVSTKQIRYFAVGEYGSLRKRPHYHIILLNCDDVRLIQDSWSVDGVPIGHVDIDPLRSIKSVAYCLKYVSKPSNHFPAGHPEFSRMSKGLGKNYLNPEIIAYHKRDHANSFVTLLSGVKISLPKYMKDRIYDSYERYRLGNYLQSRADARQAERVEAIQASTLENEEKILHSLYCEPFINIFAERLFKPTPF